MGAIIKASLAPPSADASLAQRLHLAAMGNTMDSLGPPLLCNQAALPEAPDVDACRGIMARFAMPGHIRAHSERVTQVAVFVAERAREAGMDVCVRSVQASALLHDIAKDYAIRHGGHHAQLGGAWTVEATGNPTVAQGVMHHVFWPWDVDIDRGFLPLTVIYADKRVRHQSVVSVADRYDDLFDRYGATPDIRARIQVTMNQALDIEQQLGNRLGIDLHACTFDSGRLV
ncbi:MAG: HD domain-containing protein [Desulfovibrionaceae bacterium]